MEDYLHYDVRHDLLRVRKTGVGLIHLIDERGRTDDELSGEGHVQVVYDWWLKLVAEAFYLAYQQGTVVQVRDVPISFVFDKDQMHVLMNIQGLWYRFTCSQMKDIFDLMSELLDKQLPQNVIELLANW